MGPKKTVILSRRSPWNYPCGKENTYNHILICKKGGFVNSRHNRLRDTIASVLEKICNEVVVEPMLQPCTGESLRKGTCLEDGARLDIAARGLWSPMEMAFFIEKKPP